MAKPTLTEQDFQRASKKLRCEVPAIKAVAEVESRGKGFYASGFPVILFERHIFRKYTQGRYNKTHPHLSGPAGNYGAAGQNQINKFNEAFKLNPIAAMKSCSWGKFQIMGFNYEICGYEDVGSFVDAMKESEGKHLDAFVEFVIGNGLAIHLRTKNWAAFAKGYNGAGYKKNNYDVKMAKAYARHSAASNATLVATPVEDTDSSGTPTSASHPSEPPTNIETTTVAVKDGAVTSTTTTVSEEAEIEGVRPYNGSGLSGTLKNDAKAILPANIGLSTISEWIQQTTGWPEWVAALIPKLVIIALVCTALWLVYRLLSWLMWNWRENERVKLQAMINANPHMKDIVLK